MWNYFQKNIWEPKEPFGSRKSRLYWVNEKERLDSLKRAGIPITMWNSLPHDIVDAPSLPVLKSRLQSFLGNDLFSFWSHSSQFHPPTLPYPVSSSFVPFDIFLSIFLYWKIDSISESLWSCSNTGRVAWLEYLCWCFGPAPPCPVWLDTEW